ncbi:hypothetical protein ABC977_01915 [Thioalkalicoccus limnaeus]|uniref:Uncharacterized protein n=1 Tax=Thioalkalicoccus limnaeus TaxID=120681 RepID=A0ABV4B9U9_9GAMM
MTDSRFDLVFAGQLVAGVDPLVARWQLQAVFELSDEAVARLFSGHRIVIKRNVDPDTASRYQERFREAGASIELIPVIDADPTDPTGATDQAAAPGMKAAATRLTLAPPGSPLLDDLHRPSHGGPPAPDTSHLSLATGTNWTLEDSARHPPPAPIPDTSHLTLEPVVPETK